MTGITDQDYVAHIKSTSEEVRFFYIIPLSHGDLQTSYSTAKPQSSATFLNTFVNDGSLRPFTTYFLALAFT